MGQKYLSQRGHHCQGVVFRLSRGLTLLFFQALIFVRGQYLPYPPDDGIGIPSQPEPVNATAFFLSVRENLSQFAQDVFEQFHHQHSLFDSQRRHFDEDTPIDTIALARNREFLEAMRMKIGIHWRQLHEIPKIDPADNDNLTVVWKALVETVRGLHDRLCATCGVRVLAVSRPERDA